MYQDGGAYDKPLRSNYSSSQSRCPTNLMDTGLGGTAGHSPEGGCVFREAESDTSSQHITNSSFGNVLLPALVGLLPCALLTVPHGQPQILVCSSNASAYLLEGRVLNRAV